MLLALVGPTASGKTEAGILLATALHAEVVSVDSMLVYRGMDVGTAKPSEHERARVPHHLLDLADPAERFSVARFQAEAARVLPEIDRPLLVGGSGLYFRSVVDDLRFPPEDAAVRAELEVEVKAAGPAALYRRLADLDPVAAERIEPGNARRIVRALEVAAITGELFSSFAEAWRRYDPARVRVAGIRMDRATLSLRVAARVRAMLADGWIEEVAGLVERGFGGWLTSTQAIGYAELASHLDGRLGFDEAVEHTISRTKELARRQMAWFKRDPRIHWFDAGEEGALSVTEDVRRYLESPV